MLFKITYLAESLEIKLKVKLWKEYKENIKLIINI